MHSGGRGRGGRGIEPKLTMANINVIAQCDAGHISASSVARWGLVIDARSKILLIHKHWRFHGPEVPYLVTWEPLLFFSVGQKYLLVGFK